MDASASCWLGSSSHLDPLPAWRRGVAQLVVREVPGEHLELVGANVPTVAHLLDEVLADARGDALAHEPPPLRAASA